jgi:hypothetical protein
MIWSALGSHLPQSGNPLVVHGHARALRVSAAIAATLLLAPPARDTVVAQTSPAPAVRVVRDVRFNGPVWPADMNRDGITDLISSSATTFVNGVPNGGMIQVAIGKGDGTFNAPVQSTFRGAVVGAADFNGDGNPDVIAVTTFTTNPPGRSFVILPGTGSTALGAPRTIAPAFESSFALTADMNGDGKRDLIVEGTNGVAVHPGNGDFTFGTPARLDDFNGPVEGIVADFNGDGKRDLAIVNFTNSVSIFINHGALLFSGADISLPDQVFDATAADVNGDGRVDLLVSGGRVEDQSGFGDGAVFVLPGNGNGTFGAPFTYPVARGPVQIVVGDFNRDGITDIATGNRSSIVRDDCADSFKTWDSVSILRGAGDGTFIGPWNFSIGDQGRNDPGDINRYRNTLSSLNTSDLNGDGATDLIASWGAVLFNIPAAINRPPVANAGPDFLVQNTHEVIIRFTASDPDNDMLTWEVRDETGRVIANHPIVCFQELHVGANTFTVAVDDGHGHRASDSVVITMESTVPPMVTVDRPAFGERVPAAPYTIRWTQSDGETPLARFDLFSSSDDGAHFTAIAECTNLGPAVRQCVWQHPVPPSTTSRIKVTVTDTAGRSGDGLSLLFTVLDGSGNAMPPGWANTDIGSVAAAGSAGFNGSLWTVSGSGADIWNTADEFHFAYHPQPIAFEIETRVESVQNVHPWTKAGVMVRSSLDPGATQASIFVSPGNGVSFQRRKSPGGTSLATTRTAINAPVWLRLTGLNGVIRGYYRKNLTDRWTLVGQDTLTNYPSTGQVNVGIAVTSHADGTLAKATFSNLRSNALPDWVGARAIGSTTASVVYDGTDYALTARGSDIWGVGDAFAYFWTGTAAEPPDTTIIARVVSIDNTHEWAKSGLMFRESFDPGGKHVFLMVTPGKGLSLQYRAQISGQSAVAASAPGVAPRWLKLQRSGNTFTASYSIDGVSFVQFGTVTVDLSIPCAVGLAHTTHNNAVAGAARFDNVRLIRPGFDSQ